MPNYVMKEMPDLQGKGETITYPQMVMTGQTSTRELAEYIAMKCAFSKGVTEGVICELGEALAHEMGLGRSVKIEGLGVFTPTLALLPDKEREKPEEDATKRNAQSIYVGGVNFRVDKELVRGTNEWCNLKRAPLEAGTLFKEVHRRTTATPCAAILERAPLPHRQELPAVDRISTRRRHRGTAEVGTHSRHGYRHQRIWKPPRVHPAKDG